MGWQLIAPLSSIIFIQRLYALEGISMTSLLTWFVAESTQAKGFSNKVQ